MNRLKSKSPAVPVPIPPIEKPAVPASLLVERLLIGGTSALIVARPLVSGNDPGRLQLTSGAGPLSLNLLTFLLLLGWTVWRAWTKRPLRRGPMAIVVFGLLAIAGLAFASAAGPDRYQRPGWFIAWEWLALAAMCFLVGQLAGSNAISRGFLAVMLATAASLSAQALYQQASRPLSFPSTEADALPTPAMPLVGDGEFGLTLNQPPPLRGHFRATFDQPDTLAGFLLLLLPLAIGWGLAGGRGGKRSRIAALVPALLLTATLFALSSWLTSTPILGAGWRSVKMIEGLSLLGVGPGNFSRNAENGLVSAGSSWLELAVTMGLLAAGILVGTWLFALTNVVRRRGNVSPEMEEVPPRIGPRWEFYHGGVVGLLLGMILATGDIPAEADATEMLRLGIVAAGRALVWFIAFALLENASIHAGTLMRLLSIGIVLVALLGIVSAGSMSFSLQQPFWIATTLALAFVGGGRVARPLSLPLLAWIGVPLAIVLIAANVVHVYVAGVSTASAARSARAASKAFPHAHWQTEGRKDLDHIQHVHEADDFLTGKILEPLRNALKVDPENSTTLLELAHWNRWHWHYLQELRRAQQARIVALETLQLAERATKIDPRNPAAKRSQFEAVLQFARESTAATSAQLNSLEKLIAEIAEREPQREVLLRYRVALTLLDQKNLDPIDVWTLRVLQLDDEEGSPHGRLTADQRRRLIERVKRVIQRPTKELAEFLLGNGE